jgi:hypothetical protein
VRQCTHTGRPLGNEGFVYDPEQVAKRPLTPRKGSRPAILAAEKRQGELLFFGSRGFWIGAAWKVRSVPGF